MELVLRAFALTFLVTGLVDASFATRGFNPWDDRADLPAGFFTLLRLSVTAASAYTAWAVYRVSKHPSLLIIVYGSIAVLFQPLVPVEFSYQTWQWINLLTFLFMCGELWWSLRTGRMSAQYFISEGRGLTAKIQRSWKLLAVIVVLPVLYGAYYGSQAFLLDRKISYNRTLSFLCRSSETQTEGSLTPERCKEAQKEFHEAAVAACHLNVRLPFDILNRQTCRHSFGISIIGGRVQRVPTMMEEIKARQEQRRRANESLRKILPGLLQPGAQSD